MKPESAEGLRLRLKPGEEERLLSGHPWAFSNELESVPRDAEPGCLAELSSSKGRPLGIGFFNPRSLISWRLLSRGEPVGPELFKSRIEAALEFRRRLYPGERSFRLAFGESDGLPGLVADKYEDVVSLQVLAAGMERRIAEAAGALEEVLKPKGVYLNNDHPARVLEGLGLERRVLSGEVPERVVIEEAGLRHVVSLAQGQKTGFYFDQRDNRARLRPYFQGRKILDLYCYTGAFSLAAARHGAEKVLGLDSSGPAIRLARASAEMNGLSDRCGFDEGDAEEVLAAFSSGRQPFEPDMILLDPPSFAPSRKHQMKALRAYARVNGLALSCLRGGGLLATSTCTHHVGREDFLRMLRQAAAKAGRRARLLELGTQSRDHPILLSMPETEYLHFAVLEVLGRG